MLWTVGRLNPFGGESVEKEEVVWKRLKGKEYVHLPLVEVSFGCLTNTSRSYRQTLASMSCARAVLHLSGPLIIASCERCHCVPGGEPRYRLL